MTPFRDRAGDIALQTRQADVEAGSQQELVTGCAEINLGINSDIGRKRDLHVARHTAHRPDEAGRPAGGKQLLRIGAGAGAARGRQLDVKPAIFAAGSAARPPSVWVSAVYITVSRWVIVGS
jgi:hypothetical protein